MVILNVSWFTDLLLLLQKPPSAVCHTDSELCCLPSIQEKTVLWRDSDLYELTEQQNGGLSLPQVYILVITVDIS